MIEREDDLERLGADDEVEPLEPEPLDPEVPQPNSLLANQLSEQSLAGGSEPLPADRAP